MKKKLIITLTLLLLLSSCTNTICPLTNIREDQPCTIKQQWQNQCEQEKNPEQTTIYKTGMSFWTHPEVCACKKGKLICTEDLLKKHLEEVTK